MRSALTVDAQVVRFMQTRPPVAERDIVLRMAFDWDEDKEAVSTEVRASLDRLEKLGMVQWRQQNWSLTEEARKAFQTHEHKGECGTMKTINKDKLRKAALITVTRFAPVKAGGTPVYKAIGRFGGFSAMTSRRGDQDAAVAQVLDDLALQIEEAAMLIEGVTNA